MTMMTRLAPSPALPPPPPEPRAPRGFPPLNRRRCRGQDEEAEEEFWGLEVKAGKKVSVKVNDDDDVVVHITQIALGPSPKPGDAAVSLEIGGKKFFLGTLNKETNTEFGLDLPLDDTFTIRHTGPNSIYLTGYTETMEADEGEDDEDGDDDDDDEKKGDDDDEARAVFCASLLPPAASEAAGCASCGIRSPVRACASQSARRRTATASRRRTSGASRCRPARR